MTHSAARLTSRDRGSVIPLVLGFFLIVAWVAGGGVALANASMQRSDLQAFCDGAAAAGASSGVNGNAIRSGIAGGERLPLSPDLVEAAIADYQRVDPAHHDVDFAPTYSADGRTVALACSRRIHVFAEILYLHPHGVVEHVTSTAEEPRQ